MREIKFRAWDTKNSKMTNDFTVLSNGSIGKIYRRQVLHGHNDYGNELIIGEEYGYGLYTKDLIPMEYTMVKDSKGKEIYEGDVVYIAGLGNHIIEFPFIELYEASFENDIGKIRGNIYENPELLEGKDE